MSSDTSNQNKENQMNLFAPPLASGPKNPGPLAHRLRPQELDQFIGHENTLGPGKPLRVWIENDNVPSLVFWGPPGCGKTTLAQLIAHRTHCLFITVSAVQAGIKDLKDAIERARFQKDQQNRKTILFIDEIHRFNKTQQDFLLPFVEQGLVTLIGATTENPSFEINQALLSRVRVIRFERLSTEALITIIERALKDRTRGLGGLLRLSDPAINFLAQVSDGDARRALTFIENLQAFASNITHPLSEEEVQKALQSLSQNRPMFYDKSGEEHYNVISAFIKSIRDSDPHAGLYYLARMLEGGEDPLFIARRLVILASEDVGNADPRALQVALNVKDAVDFIGMPEARISLAQAVTYIALAPKSNASYSGIEEALEEVRHSGGLPVPLHLRNAPTALLKQEGYHQGYRYAHEDPQNRARQTHLPQALLKKRFYRPKAVGLEKAMQEKLELLNPDFDGTQ